jgi:hypothetical protein
LKEPYHPRMLDLNHIRRYVSRPRNPSGCLEAIRIRMKALLPAIPHPDAAGSTTGALILRETLSSELPPRMP